MHYQLPAVDQPDLSDYTSQLQHLMHQTGITSFAELSRKTGISRRQLARIRQGEIAQLPVITAWTLSQVFQIPLPELLAQFSPELRTADALPAISSQTLEDDLERMRQECQRLQVQLTHQRQDLWQNFQFTLLEALKPLLINWPTAAYRARSDQRLPAVKLLPLLAPLEQLLKLWNVETIGSVGELVHYNPQLHQLKEGPVQQRNGHTITPGSNVKVERVGYRLEDRLLQRAVVIAE